jgi:plastocyanin
VANRRLAVLGAGLVAAGIILIAAAAALGSGPGSLPGQPAQWGSGPGPGSPGFVAGTVSAPRVVRIVASGARRFFPDSVTVKQGETITFEVTSMGMSVHEFMVGPAADVAADSADTPEVADIGIMATKSLTYTFNGPGPYAFACHAPGHYEAGMRGVIVVVG